MTLARHAIHAMQPDVDVLPAGRPAAIEFATIAAVNDYWRR